MSGVFHVLLTNSPWRDLPERYGPYATVYNRFNRWSREGVWLAMFEALAARSPPSLHLIDSSIARARQHAAGGKKGVRITPSAVLVATRFDKLARNFPAAVAVSASRLGLRAVACTP